MRDRKDNFEDNDILVPRVVSRNKNIYLLIDFDTTWGSKFRDIKFLLFGKYLISSITGQKAIKALSTVFFSWFLQKFVLNLMLWCQYNGTDIYTVLLYTYS